MKIDLFSMIWTQWQSVGTRVALEIREFARSGILYYLVRPVLFPEFTTQLTMQLTMQLTVAPRSRYLVISTGDSPSGEAPGYCVVY